MFFELSKILWFFAQPSNVILIMLALGGALGWSGRERPGLQMCAAGAALYAILGLSPVGHLLLLPLEERFLRPELQPDYAPKGVIVLGGAVDSLVSGARGQAALNEAAERMTEAVALSRRFPQALIVFTGGSAELIYETEPETEAAKRLFTALGVDPSRVIYESQSRNTYENAQWTRAALGDRADGDWVLVTSAFHMPRAMGLFRAAGFKVRPWPVDYRTRGAQDAWRFFARSSEGLRRADLAAKEWAGLLVYWLSGRTDALFPG